MFFFKQKTAYEMRISDWSSDVCSSDLEATEDGRSDDADACKAAFESAMAALESQANYALTDIDYTTPAPAMAAATPSQTPFIVLFDFDSVDYAPGNGTILRDALDAALARAGSAPRLTGPAHASGPAPPNPP